MAFCQRSTWRALQDSCQNCPSYQLQKETQHHLFICPCHITKWLDIIKDLGIGDTSEDKDPYAQEIMLWAITNQNKRMTAYPINDIPQHYHPLIQAQQDIGWHQILLGRWTTEWAKYYEQKHPLQGRTTAHHKLSLIWNGVIQLWHLCCANQHKNSHETNITSRERHPKVHALYAVKPKLDNIDQRALEQPISSITKMPIKTLKDWLKRTTGFVQQGLIRAKQRLKTTNHSLTTFFLPHPRQQTSQADFSSTSSNANQARPNHLISTQSVAASTSA
jgi:hypothetical protein